MARTSNYRSKIVETIENANDHHNSLLNDEEPFEFIGTLDEELDIECTIKAAEKILRLLDGLKVVGVEEGKGFCDQIAQVTGYSKTRISNMLSGNAALNSRFIRAVCTGFGLSEEYLLEGKGSVTTTTFPHGGVPKEDVAIREAVSVLSSMTEPERWRAVAMLKEMIIPKTSNGN